MAYYIASDHALDRFIERFNDVAAAFSSRAAASSWLARAVRDHGVVVPVHQAGTDLVMHFLVDEGDRPPLTCIAHVRPLLQQRDAWGIKTVVSEEEAIANIQHRHV